MRRLVIATGNPHKVQELRALLNLTGVEFLGLSDLPGAPFPEPRESGATFEANATIKALSYAKATGLPCLADDSGLEVDALRGAPGVISSHYSTDGRETGLPRHERDLANNQRLLRELAETPADRRTARFVCVMVLADGARILAATRGTCEGRIGFPGEVPRGGGGFGYDPLFLIGPGFARTSAELSSQEKNAISHRGNAARAMAEAIRSLP